MIVPVYAMNDNFLLTKKMNPTQMLVFCPKAFPSIHNLAYWYGIFLR
jgi:hypothetical protein